MKYFICLITLISFLVLSVNGFCHPFSSYENESLSKTVCEHFNADHNFGGALLLTFNDDGTIKISDFGGGVGANFNLTARDCAGTNDNHLVFIDTSLKVMIGGGLNNDTGNGDFVVDIKGNLTGGMQAYKFLPLTLSMEDIEMRIGMKGVDGRYLVGTALLLPLGNLSFMATVGVRDNSMVKSDSVWPGMQLKLTYKPQTSVFEEIANLDEMGEYLVASGAFIFDLSKGGINEKTSKIEIGINNVLIAGSQISLEGSWTKIETAKEQKEGGALMLFIGADIL